MTSTVCLAEKVAGADIASTVGVSTDLGLRRAAMDYQAPDCGRCPPRA